MGETWQSAPDAPGLWWRDGGDGPVAWEVRKCAAGTNRLYAQEAVGEMDLAEILDLSPRAGVRWARCAPPEILAPNEPTRAEFAAQLAAVTAERDALRAEVSRG